MKWPFHTAEGQILEGLESLPWRRLIVSLKRGRFSASNVWIGAKLCRFRAFSMGFPWFSPRFPHEGPFTSTAHVFLIAKKKHQWPEEHRMSRSPLGLDSRSPSRMSKVRGTLGGPTE